MNNCVDCKKDFDPLPGKDWAKQCFDCWKKAKKNEAGGAVAGTTAESPPKPVANRFNDPERERRIVRQSSLQRAIEFGQYRRDTNEQSDLSIQQILTVAGTFEAWVMREHNQ